MQLCRPETSHIYGAVSSHITLRVSFGYNGSSYNEYHEYHCSSNYGTGDYNDTGFTITGVGLYCMDD